MSVATWQWDFIFQVTQENNLSKTTTLRKEIRTHPQQYHLVVIQIICPVCSRLLWEGYPKDAHIHVNKNRNNDLNNVLAIARNSSSVCLSSQHVGEWDPG